MKKKLNVILLIVLITVLLSGCCIKHEYIDATCIAPKTCSKCGKTEGGVTEHVWKEATCFEPKTCSVCNATEGTTLEHTWVEATCSVPKTCNVCGTIEGETLAHTLTEANYQEPAKCTVCGEIEGDVLEPCALGIKDGMELDTVYDFVMACNGNKEETTLAKAIALNYKVFEEDEEHPGKEGYEWKTVDVRISVGDENAHRWGYDFDSWLIDYYWFSGVDENHCFEVYFNGIEYPECKYYVETDKSDWVLQQYGWENSRTILKQIHVLLPKGYDGFIYGFSGSQCEEMYDMKDGWASVPIEEYICFRFK